MDQGSIPIEGHHIAGWIPLCIGLTAKLARNIQRNKLDKNNKINKYRK